jgi:hypothetical protein
MGKFRRLLELWRADLIAMENGTYIPPKPHINLVVDFQPPSDSEAGRRQGRLREFGHG